MQKTQIVYFSADRGTLETVVTEVRELCEKKGIEFNGPNPLPVLDLGEWESELGDNGTELFGEEPTGGETQQLQGETIYSRNFNFNRYASDDLVGELVKRDYPDGIFLRVRVEQSQFIGADRGNVPPGYDPNKDYHSDI